MPRGNPDIAMLITLTVKTVFISLNQFMSPSQSPSNPSPITFILTLNALTQSPSTLHSPHPIFSRTSNNFHAYPIRPYYLSQSYSTPIQRPQPPSLNSQPIVLILHRLCLLFEGNRDLTQ